MSCTSALETLLTPIDSVSTGVVSELSHTENVQELFIDAAAGGQMGAATNPRIYLSLSTGTRVDITDVDAPTSSGWDLALKRPVIFTNSGDAGPGEGGAVYLDKSFDEVTTADLANNTLSTESFVDAECNPKYDASGAVLTTFSDWYDYDPATHVLTPKTGTYLVKGASGSAYKLEIQDYYATPDGGSGMAGGSSAFDWPHSDARLYRRSYRKRARCIRDDRGERGHGVGGLP